MGKYRDFEQHTIKQSESGGLKAWNIDNVPRSQCVEADDASIFTCRL